MNPNEDKNIKAIWNRYQSGTATAEDLALLESWYMQFEAADPETLDAEEVAVRLTQVRNHLPLTTTKKLWPRIAAAASLVLICGTGYYYHLQATKDQLKLEAKVAGIIPGRNKAILKLADGSEILLTEVQQGKIADQAGTAITKNSSGALVYTDKHGNPGTSKLNTVATPRGGKWQVQLPDGTKVWLNAATTLSYPVSFDGQKERQVTLIGEAYFEVSKDKTKPFIVHAEHQDIKVLGTHFNLNAYNDEPAVKTTLLEGSVVVQPLAGSNGARILKPGQQAVLASDNITVNTVNAQATVDWKNDEFRFKNERLNSILRKVSRWYDVDIIYKDKLKTMPTFSGSVSRLDEVSVVLKMLEEASDVHFSITGKTITVKTKD